MSHPAKNRFPISTFPYLNTIWRTNSYFIIGYVYNGVHLRGPRSRKQRQGFSHHVHHNPEATSFQTHYGKDHSQKINSNLDFNKEFESLRSKIKRNPTAQLPDVKVVVDSEFEPNADGKLAGEK